MVGRWGGRVGVGRVVQRVERRAREAVRAVRAGAVVVRGPRRRMVEVRWRMKARAVLGIGIGVSIASFSSSERFSSTLANVEGLGSESEPEMPSHSSSAGASELCC